MCWGVILWGVWVVWFDGGLCWMILVCGVVGGMFCVWLFSLFDFGWGWGL